MDIETIALKKLVEKVSSSDAFKNELGSENDYYLAHLFLQLDKDFKATNNCQIGFYSVKNDNLGMFEISKGNVSFMGFEEAFKDGGIIQKLTISNEDVCFQTAKESIIALCKEKYPAEIINNFLVIAQNIKEKNVLNCTAICLSFAMISMHIDMDSKEIIFEEKNSILDLKKDLPKEK
jgi:hypothetical protein